MWVYAPVSFFNIFWFWYKVYIYLEKRNLIILLILFYKLKYEIGNRTNIRIVLN